MGLLAYLKFPSDFSECMVVFASQVRYVVCILSFSLWAIFVKYLKNLLPYISVFQDLESACEPPFLLFQMAAISLALCFWNPFWKMQEEEEMMTEVLLQSLCRPPTHLLELLEAVCFLSYVANSTSLDSVA